MYGIANASWHNGNVACASISNAMKACGDVAHVT
jgi:hypothetical protein